MSSVSPVEPRTTGDVITGSSDESFLLSPLQQGMLFHWLLDPGSGTDIEQVVVDLHEPIDPSRLERAWQRTAGHFGTLRTSFRWEGLAAPRQEIAPAVAVPFETRDLRSLPAEQRTKEFDQFLRDDRRKGFDLGRPPLLRVALFQLGDERSRMVWTFHHALMDGRAFEVVLEDVFAGYAGASDHAVPDRPYRAFIEWLSRQDVESSRDFWRARLGGFQSPTPLPGAGGGREAEHGFAQLDVSLTRESTDRLRTLAQREGLSLNTILLGAWGLLLSRHSGRSEVLFGASKTLRRGSIADADSTIGLFLVTVPVRIRVDPALTVADWLRAVRREWVALRGHEHLPIVDMHRVSEVPAQAALFDSLVMYDTAQLDTSLRARGGEWSARRITTYEQTGLPLTLLAYGDDALALRLEYDTGRVSDEVAQQSLSELTSVLDAWGVDSARPLEESAVGSSRGREASTPQRAVVRGDHTAECVHEQFERQAALTPDATAVLFADTALTYRELNAHANRVAHLLRARGVGPETLVGICLERSLEMVVCLLAILKAGGAYVPLDPAYPVNRLAMMLEDSRVHTILTQRHLQPQLQVDASAIVLIDGVAGAATPESDNPVSGVTPDNLAYVIFTSGSTGRPKGTMVEHRNVANFFVGMDEVLGAESCGVWLAVTSISFDISVLELFWTLARGFEVVIAPSYDRASVEQHIASTRGPIATMEFGLFYFAAHSDQASGGDAYRLLLEGAKFADRHGFTAVWTPERHFHEFGGFYPNPAVTTAALATITSRVKLRAGSIVLPLHNPMRVAEDWSVIDLLSGGRVGLSFASGWHVNDFAFMPENFVRRREVMNESIETVLKLWRGETVAVTNGAGATIEISVLPRAIQTRPPIWIASAGSVETFALAGRLGANVLTNMLGQDIAELELRFAAYREARRAHGHEGAGIVTVMLHTFVTDNTEEARRLARKPFCAYLASSFDLVKMAPTMFPAFKQPSRAIGESAAADRLDFTPDDMAALLDHAFDRYFDTAGLFGTPERAMEMVERLSAIGADEVACLIDFGIDPDQVLASLPHLDRLRRLAAERAALSRVQDARVDGGIGALIRTHAVTHLQCTPSVARAIADDPRALQAMAGLDTLLLGGEALPADLADRLSSVARGRMINMYGPTETTVWSTTMPILRGRAPTIGTPIANTVVHVLDEQGEPVADGTAGELYIGGSGVVRGYLDRPELTAERFPTDRFAGTGRMYRTGDLVRRRVDGVLEYLGRIDDQVKLNGYRIELGEIEATLSRHPAVRQGVVAARGADAARRLVAYVVPADQTAESGDDAERVDAWQRLWNDAYAGALESTADGDPRFQIAGWKDSFTGRPIPADQMRRWVDATVDRIVALLPRRVLEIGCGTGLLLYRVLPHVEHYMAVDISPAALEGIRRELTMEESKHVTLLERAADQLDEVAARSVDVVIINSVAQYFPNADYLIRVLRRAVELTADGGRIFVGDVRSLEQLRGFHTTAELMQAPTSLDVNDLHARVARRLAQESELTLSASFFSRLVSAIPRLVNIDVQLKRGTDRNEMTMFRYDVVLEVGMPQRPAATRVMTSTARDLASIRAALEVEPDVLYVPGLPNSRLTGVAAVRAALEASESVSVDSLRAQLHNGDGVDPESLYSLSEAYEVHTRWAVSGDAAAMDALFVRRDRGRSVTWPVEDAMRSPSTGAVANAPADRNTQAVLVEELRSHLRQSLPEYMIPSAFVFIEKLPLTPNGKIDRKALPSPDQSPAPAAIAYVAPSGDLELQLAEIWRSLLAVEQVGRQDNIFDLGANSLLTMQANSRLSKLLGRPVPLVSMFRYPTIASLAAHLREGSEGSTVSTSGTEDKRGRDRAARAEQAAERRRALRRESGDR